MPIPVILSSTQLPIYPGIGFRIKSVLKSVPSYFMFSGSYFLQKPVIKNLRLQYLQGILIYFPGSNFLRHPKEIVGYFYFFCRGVCCLWYDSTYIANTEVQCYFIKSRRQNATRQPAKVFYRFFRLSILPYCRGNLSRILSCLPLFH